MGKKYLLEIEENKDGSFAWSNFAPYTAPDLEQVRKEAYEKGRKDVETQFCSYDACKNRQEEYQRGLNDAWEAARKICLNDSDGGLTVTEIANIFDVSYYRDAMKKYSVHEAIEKIRKYEQEKEEIIDPDKNKVEALANDIGIHKLYALVKEIRGE
jgi:hypothetical protein